MSDDPLMIEPIMEYRRACNLAGLTLEQSDLLRPFFESLLSRAEAAEAECARLRQDAERLDWVERTNPIIFHRSFDGDQWEVVTDPNGNEGGQCADTLRAAIDAAIAEGKHE